MAHPREFAALGKHAFVGVKLYFQHGHRRALNPRLHGTSRFPTVYTDEARIASPLIRKQASRPPHRRIEPTMKIFAMFVLALVSITLTACTTEQRSPDQIRKETAGATSAAARDAKAVAQGVVDGLKHGGTVNINKASGTDRKAPRHRRNRRPPHHRQPPVMTAPYELVKKHLISKGGIQQHREQGRDAIGHLGGAVGFSV